MFIVAVLTQILIFKREIIFLNIKLIILQSSKFDYIACENTNLVPENVYSYQRYFSVYLLKFFFHIIQINV